MDKTFKIGIIGSGNIGGTLGIHFAKAGHQVMFSSRNPNQLTDLAEQAGTNASTGTIIEAFDFGDVILFAFPFGKVPEVARKVGSAKGKVIIDANNYYPDRDGNEPGKEMRKKELLESEWTALYFPGAHIVKAFNTIWFKRLEEKAFAQSDRLGVVFTASNAKGREVLETILRSIHFDGLYLGDLSKSKITQPNEELYNLDSLTREELRKRIE
ncbi:MAG: NAD(P)-binding domain-containing protein [Bacteroidota bacterium]